MIQKIIFLTIFLVNMMHGVSYELGRSILVEIQKNPVKIPESLIESAVITVIDDDIISMKIVCDTLMVITSNKSSSDPTILSGNVVATFFDDFESPVSILKSDYAEYIENNSMIAKRNISIYNLDSRDSLYFINPLDAEIEWNEEIDQIQTNYPEPLPNSKNINYNFVLRTKSGCSKGVNFQSNVDLTQRNISFLKGGSRCD